MSGGRSSKEEFPLTWRAKVNSERYARTRRGRKSRAGVRSPFLHDVLFSLRLALPVLLAGFALFVVLVPVSTSVVNDISVFNVNYTHEQLKYQLYAQDLAPVVNAACVGFGAVLAVVLFRFLLEKRSTTAFFSVGLSRVKLYLSRYLAGALCIVVGIAVPFAISLLLNHLALGLYEGQVHEFFYVTSGYIVVALVAFSLASLATICAGTLFETCTFALALLFSVSVVLWGIGMLADYLLVGNAAGAALYGQDVLVAPLVSGRPVVAEPPAVLCCRRRLPSVLRGAASGVLSRAGIVAAGDRLVGGARGACCLGDGGPVPPPWRAGRDGGQGAGVLPVLGGGVRFGRVRLRHGRLGIGRRGGGAGGGSSAVRADIAGASVRSAAWPHAAQDDAFVRGGRGWWP